MSCTWFVTGATRGMGADIVKAALQQGDKVAATGRSLGALREAFADAPQDRIELLELDVRNEAQAQAAADAAVRRFARIDVQVNNAGFCLLCRFEEATAAQIEGQCATNLFGMANVLRAVLPVMRAQKSAPHPQLLVHRGRQGRGQRHVLLGLQLAVEGMTLALADEVARLGIQVTAIEPGFFRTELLGSRSVTIGERHITDYAPYSSARTGGRRRRAAGRPGQAGLRHDHAGGPHRGNLRVPAPDQAHGFLST